jgi:hypothetical protein
MDSNQVNEILQSAIDYIKDPELFGPGEDFNRVALGLYDVHRELNPVYAKYDRGPLTDWREIPLMPISEFKNGDVGLVLSDRMPFPGVEFHSSGTTKGDKSKHRMYDTEAYRASIYECFSRTLIPLTPPSCRFVLLTPQLSHSSLVYMMQYLAETGDTRGQAEFFDGMIDKARVEELLESLKNEDQTVVLFGTSLAFYDLLSTIESNGIEPITLPEQSIIIETGGWKGRDISLTPMELTKKIQAFFTLDSFDCVREYSMSEISSQLYAWDTQEPVTYNSPSWLIVRCVDPLSQTEVPHGESGIISFLDLANIWSCPFILTEDMGFIKSGELVLQGRAVNAPEKGCSLTYSQAMELK